MKKILGVIKHVKTAGFQRIKLFLLTFYKIYESLKFLRNPIKREPSTI